MDFAALSQQCAPGVSQQTMAAIVKTESGFRPLAIGINGGAKLVRQPGNKSEAVVTANWLIASGYNIDMGLGQVNSANLSRFGLSVENAFDPCLNLSASAAILTASYKLARSKGHAEQPALYAALSAYNTGSLSRGISNGYVQKVVNNAGMGQATTTIKPDFTAPIAIIKAVKPTAKPENPRTIPKLLPQPMESKATESSTPDEFELQTAATKQIMVY